MLNGAPRIIIRPMFLGFECSMLYSKFQRFPFLESWNGCLQVGFIYIVIEAILANGPEPFE